jgi:hypothetical protein
MSLQSSQANHSQRLPILFFNQVAASLDTPIVAEITLNIIGWRLVLTLHCGGKPTLNIKGWQLVSILQL